MFPFDIKLKREFMRFPLSFVVTLIGVCVTPPVLEGAGGLGFGFGPSIQRLFVF